MADWGTYIAEQLQRGYTPDQIKAAISAHGYDPAIVDQYMGSSQPAPQQVNNQLIAYIKRQLDSGYPADDVKLFLIQYGYSESQVQSAMKEVAPKKIIHEIHVSGKTFFLIFLVLTGLAGIGTGIYMFTKPGPQLDYSIELEKDKIARGDMLVFTNVFYTVDGGPGDIRMNYAISELSTGKIVKTWDETISLDTVNKKMAMTSIDFPEGRYKVKGIAKARRDPVDASQDFEVISAEDTCGNKVKDKGETGVDCGGPCEPCTQETCSDGIKNQDELAVDCGGSCRPCIDGTCKDGIRNQDEADVDCGGVCPACKKACDNGIRDGEEEEIDCGGDCEPCPETCTDGFRNQDETGIDCGGSCAACKTGKTPELMQAAKNIAKDQPDEAAKLCSQIDEPEGKDICYVDISRLSNESTYCAAATPAYRDGCYLYFVAQGDYSVCENIADTYIRMNCESLKAIRRSS